ncbi:patatin-like phospholipase family protein [Gellertiella hungarica]|uniref:NTE family protein n=1 Tax=Gellertiella hungarica TaxID=1572859 RepID=A0A7W6NK91_9HYPH|nr:patatin-like phospholipase family protein [Gellertiella hungarica]MBB4064314.1 NTE family protein [Gellertiella hungarica]
MTRAHHAGRTSPSGSTPTIAIAFGGGGARGLAHIHVIEALDELGIRPVAISGASIGAIMGAGMAAGLSGAEIREHTLATVGNRANVVNRLWSLRPSTVKAAMSGGFRMGQFNLERILGVFLPEALPEDFADLQIPLKVSATDYYGQCEKVIETGALVKALAASAALPAIFMPVTVEGRVMIDGGIFNPVPYEELLPLADIVIGIDVVGGPEGDGTHVPNRLDSLFGASQLMMQANIALKLKLGPPHIFLRPAVNRFRVLDFLKAGQVLDASAGIKEDLKRALESEMEKRLRAS